MSSWRESIRSSSEGDRITSYTFVVDVLLDTTYPCIFDGSVTTVHCVSLAPVQHESVIIGILTVEKSIIHHHATADHDDCCCCSPKRQLRTSSAPEAASPLSYRLL